MATTIQKGIYFMQGNVAFAEGALLANCRFFAGYPITPSTEICETMARKLPKLGGIFVQAEDEIAAMGMILGASWGGLKSMTATSGPGFSLMQESIGYACMTETPCVIVNVQRGGPGTGQPTLPSQHDVLQARYGAHGEYAIISLAPASAQEMFYTAIDAFNLAEKYRVPVIVLADEIVGHSWERVEVPDPDTIQILDRKKPSIPPEEYYPYKPDSDLVPPMAVFGEGYRILVESQVHDERGFMRGTDTTVAEKLLRRLVDKVEQNADRISRVETRFMEDAEIAVVSYGSVSRPALRAVKQAREHGIKVGWIRLIGLWPLPKEKLKELLNNVDIIIMPEMNLGKIVKEVELIAKEARVIPLPKIGGELHTPLEILDAIEKLS